MASAPLAIADEVATALATAIADEVAPKSVSATKNARTILISQNSFTLVVCRLPGLPNPLVRFQGWLLPTWLLTAASIKAVDSQDFALDPKETASPEFRSFSLAIPPPVVPEETVLAPRQLATETKACRGAFPKPRSYRPSTIAGIDKDGRTTTPRWPVADLRSGIELKTGHGAPTEPGQCVKAVALVDEHDLVDLADDEDVGSQGVVDAAYKDRHSSPGLSGQQSTSQHDESRAFECGCFPLARKQPR